MNSINETNFVGRPSLLDLRDIIATVLDITDKAWLSVVKNKLADRRSTERKIAGYLGNAMISEKNRLPSSKQQIRIEEEVGTRSPKAKNTDGRIDIKIIYSWDEREYFGMECKRVSGNSKVLAEKYVKDGVIRFVSGKYSSGHHFGAMLGFVIDGKTTECISLISEQLNKKQTETQQIESWAIEQNFLTKQKLYRTRHNQTGIQSSITLLHLFLSIE